MKRPLGLGLVGKENSSKIRRNEGELVRNTTVIGQASVGERGSNAVTPHQHLAKDTSIGT
jgi:hypothetical protein